MNKTNNPDETPAHASSSDHAYAEDMGFSVCPRCGVTYIPQPLVNDGHDCRVG